MKVSFALTYDHITRHVFAKQRDLRRLQEELSQGKALLNQSDNPLAWARVMDMKNAVQKATRWKENSDFGTNWNTTTEGHLNSLNDLLTRAREIAIKAIKVNDDESITSYTKELDQLLREALTTANATYQNRFLFAVNNDPATPLFGYTEVNGEITAISDPADPTDLAEPLTVIVGDAMTARVNVDGQRLFFDGSGESILKNLLDLKNAIASRDTDAVSDAMGAVEADQARVLEALTTVGAQLSRFEARSTTLDAIMVSQRECISDLEDADMATLATDYQLTVTTLEAMYQATSRVSNLSLLQYL